jgi:hypothetical protein
MIEKLKHLAADRYILIRSARRADFLRAGWTKSPLTATDHHYVCNKKLLAKRCRREDDRLNPELLILSRI